MSLSPYPLASEAALLLIDLQAGILDNSHTVSAKRIKLAAETAVKVSALLKVPAFASVVPTGSRKPEPIKELSKLPVFTRHHAGCFNQPEIRDAVGATGRKVLAIGGVVTEVAVLHGALTAMREGYTVYVLVDCCGGLSARTEQATLARLEAAGATLSSVASFFTEISNDFSTPDGAKMLALLHGYMAKE